MSDVRRYLASIGRRGGIRSRRSLDSEVARRMVDIREARRTARRAKEVGRIGNTAEDTNAAAQAFRDELLRRTSPADKLRRVARLSRAVDQLSIAGLRQRHASDSEEVIRLRRAEMRLGQEMAARVFASRRLNG